MQVLVGLNLNSLTETDNIVASENVLRFNAHHTVDVATHGALVHVGGVQAVRLINVVLANAQVTNELTLSFLIAKTN